MFCFVFARYRANIQLNNKEHFPFIMIDKRSYLEVADIPAHRYAKNLRAYFQIYPERDIIETNVRIYKLKLLKMKTEKHFESFIQLENIPDNSIMDQWNIFDDFFAWLKLESVEVISSFMNAWECMYTCACMCVCVHFFLLNFHQKS